MSNSKLRKLLKSVLQEIKPSLQELKEERAFAKEIVARLKRHINAEITVTGSVAKGTFLRESKDLDIFLLFKQSVPKEKFESLTKSAVAKAFPRQHYVISYAEHPYVRLHLSGRRIDIVPAYKITNASQLKSAVDRSVLHAKFILANLRKKQIDEVLLLKKFLKSNALYGAEIRVQGFSGYLCELIILHYKSFVNLLKSVRGWKLPIFIDLKKYYKKNEITDAIKKFHSPLVVIDPTDKNRNVAAAVSIENVKLFAVLSKRFLQNTNNRFFASPPSFYGKLKKIKQGYLIRLEKPDVVDDILWGQIRKMERLLIDFLEKHDFEVKKILDDADDEIKLAVSLKENVLPREKLILGPPLKLKDNVKKFKLAHKRSRFIIKNKKVCAYAKREIRNAEDALKLFFKSTELPSHLDSKSIKIISIS